MLKNNGLIAPIKSHGKLILVITILSITLISAYRTGLYQKLSMAEIQQFLNTIRQLQGLAPIAYILTFVMGCLLLCPAPPFVAFAGALFGIVMGTVWTIVAAGIADSLAFLIARYAARGLVLRWAKNNRKFNLIEAGIQKNGWKILIITRLIPAFPYMLQSYAFGVTSIRFHQYITASWLCTIPGIIAFSCMGSAIHTEQPPAHIAANLTIGVIIFLFIVFIPRFLFSKSEKQNKPLKLLSN
ncbi:TVP38/TMEM64 family protein [Endozoicomonas sp. Mp262]|uniref:TVP38/TMEM64 family protein n=1 Tax=Endozoicomonas sp. Mp262 TaxID=2919499 RepID=UPI0021D83EFD